MCIQWEDLWSIINSQDWTGAYILDPFGILVMFSRIMLWTVLIHSFNGICF